MATAKSFEDLEIWKQAFELYKRLKPILKQLQDSHHFEIKNQLERSAGSVMDNIAEGFERDGNREFIQFLSISKGSLGEVRSQLYRSQECLEFENISMDEHLEFCRNLSGKISNFIKYLRDSDIRGRKFA